MEDQHRKVKHAVDSILGVNSVVRRKKKNQADKSREVFAMMMNRLEEASVRSSVAYLELKMDMSAYDENYLEVIDALLYAMYGKECCDLISFYLYDRFDPETGDSVPIIVEETGQEIFLTDPYQLYEIMRRVNKDIP
jgi:hypothetical protein